MQILLVVYITLRYATRVACFSIKINPSRTNKFTFTLQFLLAFQIRPFASVNIILDNHNLFRSKKQIKITFIVDRICIVESGHFRIDNSFSPISRNSAAMAVAHEEDRETRVTPRPRRGVACIHAGTHACAERTQTRTEAADVQTRSGKPVVLM